MFFKQKQKYINVNFTVYDRYTWMTWLFEKDTVLSSLFGCI